MNVSCLALGPIGANCYFLKDSGALCLIDPGDEPERVLSMVEEGEEELQLILLTHGHYDHTGAVKALTQKYPDVPVYIHKGDAQGAGTRIFPLVGEVSNLKDLEDGQKLKIGQSEITVYTTPGHSLGSVCFETNGHLFTGDTLFCGSMGRVDLPGGDYAVIMDSLKKLSKLPENWKVHPGHDRSSSIGMELVTNPYMHEAMG